MNARISVCIPAYNRAAVLPALLDSILAQDHPDYDIVICEDGSPQRAEIAAVVAGYDRRHPGRIHYFENERNLGYDGNLRHLLEVAGGDYCLFMGNDDLMAEGALTAVAAALDRHPDIGVLLRSYAAFDEDPKQPVQVFRYFAEERFFPAGEQSVVTAFRRSVVISGMTLQRRLALDLATDLFDGSLLYQLYLVARMLTRSNAVFLPQIIALYRNGGVPDFGNAESEKGKFVPKQQTPESSVHFMSEVLRIAEYVQRVDKVDVYRPILQDYARYSYPFLAIQAGRPAKVFLAYARALHRLGFGCSPLFYVYCLSLLALGRRGTDALIGFIKRRLGHTPRLGKLYTGRSA